VIQEYPNLISDKRLNSLIDLCQKVEKNNKRPDVAGYLQEYSIGEHDDLIALVQDRLKEYLKPLLVVELDDFEVSGPKVLEVGIGESIPIHYDAESKLEIIGGVRIFKSRVIIALLYLRTRTDGATMFPVQNVCVKQEAGKLVMFPAGILFPHTITPPMTSVRRILRFEVVPKLDNFIAHE